MQRPWRRDNRGIDHCIAQVQHDGFVSKWLHSERTNCMWRKVWLAPCLTLLGHGASCLDFSKSLTHPLWKNNNEEAQHLTRSNVAPLLISLGPTITTWNSSKNTSQGHTVLAPTLTMAPSLTTVAYVYIWGATFIYIYMYMKVAPPLCTFWS